MPLVAMAESTYCQNLGSTDIFTNLMAGCAVSIFTPAQNDLSLVFLQMIFGSVGNSLAGSSNPLVGQIFYIFNTGILLITSTLIGYSAFLTAMATSQDGSSMGGSSKGFGNPWVTMRVVGGTSLLIPSFNGYSGMQILVMYVVVQGVGFADTMWSTALSYMSTTGNPVVTVPVDHTQKNLEYLVQNNSIVDNLYQSSLCWAANSMAYPSANCSTNCLVPSDTTSMSCTSGQDATQCAINISDGGTNGQAATTTVTFPYGCGSYTFIWQNFGVTNPSNTSIPSATIMANALNQVISMMFSNAQSSIQSASSIVSSAVANGVSSGSITQNINSITGGCTTSSCMPATLYASAASTYLQYENYIVQAMGYSAPAGQTTWVNDATNQGWITAGMYYFNLAQIYSATNTSGTYSTTAPQSGVTKSTLKSQFATTRAPVAPDMPSSPTNNVGYITAAWNYNYNLTQLTSSSGGSCPEASGVSSSIGCQATALVNSMATTDIPTGSGGTQADTMYGQSMQQMLNMMQQLDTSIYTSLLPSGIGDGWINLSPCNMIMPLARFNSYVLGGALRVIMGLNVDFWQTDDSGCQNIYSGSFGDTVSGIINGPNGTTCATSNAQACINDLSFCTASALSTCMAGQFGFFPTLYAASNGGYMDPIYSTSQMGIQLMAIAINYWVTLTQDVFNTIIAASWALFGMSLPIQILADLFAALTYGNMPVVGGMVYALAEVVVLVMKIFFELSKAVLEMYLPLGASMASVIFGVGVMMGIYVPFMPFMLFLFGVIGWIMAVIEAMVAAPLVALGITHPEGHDLLGKSEQAVMLLLGVFVRPVTMILGLLFAMNLAQIAVQLLDYGFLFVFNNISSSSNSSIGAIASGVIFMGGIVVYVYVLMMVIDQAYSLIYQVPDKILRWIGGPQDTSSAAQMANQVKGQVQQIGGKVGDAGSSTAGQSPGVQGQTVQGAQYKKQDKKSDKTTIKAE